jgi:hypothetical protein
MVKIGYTAQDESANKRIAQLYTTGVPVPFTIEHAGKVYDGAAVESALHTAFDPYRVNRRREFFRIDPDQAVVILRLLELEDVTAQVAQQPNEIDAESLAAAEQLRSRRPNMNFQEMGIPDGAILTSADQLGTTVTVVYPKKVRLGEDEMSLTAATRQVLGIDYSVQPSSHWTFDGRSLRDIYEETYIEAE